MLERRYGFAVGLFVVLGVALRVVLINHYPGWPSDIADTITATHQLTRHGLHAYAYLTPGYSVWPYPPLWLGVDAVALHVGHLLGVSDGVAVRLPIIAVDAFAIWLVQYAMRLTGASTRAALVAAGLVAFGPPFLAETALQGQIDIAAACSVLVAAVLWIRAPQHRRWWLAGLALGVGAGIKSVPILGILALIPTATGNRERLKLASVTVAVPALVLLPFQVGYGSTVRSILAYHGLPGLGGLSVVVQPTIVHDWQDGVVLNLANRTLHTISVPLVLAAIVAAGWFAVRHRLQPIDAAVLVYGALVVANPNFFLQYGIWLLVPLIAAGYLRIAAVASVYWILPIAMLYSGELGLWSSHPPTALYAAACDITWIGSLAVVVAVVLRFRRADQRDSSAR